jgi:hypothetical protein
MAREHPGTRGATLVELLMGMIVASILAGGLLRMVMVDLRFAEDREAWRTARQAARSGLVVLAADLRMIETGGGIEAATSGGQDLIVRAPYAFGVLCATTGSASVVSLLPADSVMVAQPGHSGFAWRHDGTGAYTYVVGGAISAALPASCTSAGITILPGSRVVSLAGAVPPTLPVGSIVFLYRRTRYEVRSSAQMPGQVALWRTLVTAGSSEEIAAPFAPGARFRFHTSAFVTPQSAVPSPLSSITGLELAFGGQSDRTPRGATGPKVVPFSTSIYFHNRTP